MQHVATWKEGDEKWAYHEDAEKHMGTHKVSLDPYRLESRRILACIKKALPDAPLQKVEKASIDEVFMDLSAQIHSILLERFPELRGPAPYDDPTENLPPPPTSALEWDTDALVDLDSHETEDDDPDWDDIAMLIGSEIVRSVRAAIKEELKYTCSGGVSHNKMLAKLGSAHKKPNQQTVIRNRAVNQFLGSFKFTKIRNLGGKLGEDIVSTFGTEEVKELLEVPLEQLKKKVGDDTGSWVYHIIRGQDTSEVNSRTQIKSMLSAKSFRPSINSYDQAVRWLRIFVADIFSRLVEEGVLDNKRRPKTLNLHHRQGAQTRSRQIPIPSGKSISEAGLFGLAKTVLGQVIVDGRAWPCANLSLSVGGFEDGPTGNKGIGTFLVKGEEAKAMNATRQAEATTFDSDRPAKRQKMESASIQNFFGRSDSLGGESGAASEEDSKDHTLNDEQIEDDIFLVDDTDDSKQQRQQQASLDSFYCEKCSKSVSNEEKAEHDDWHFAKELQESERVVVPPVTPATTPSASVTKKTPFTKPQRGRPRTQPGGLNPGKGQSKLNFGR
jgi:DNA polymerase eta